MAERIILYPENETIIYPNVLPFGVTKNLTDKLTELGINYRNYLDRLSKTETFIIVKDEDEDNSYRLLTEKVILKCKINTDEYGSDFIIITCWPKRSKDQNWFIKNGMQLISEKGAVFSYNGGLIGSFNGNMNTLKDSLNRNIELFESIEPCDFESDNDEDEWELSEEFADLLDMAEQYVLIEDELEQVRIAASSGFVYEKCEPNFTYSRVEKLSYTFYCKHVELDSVREGIRVRVPLKNNDYIVGTIAQIAEDENDKNIVYLVVSFNEKFNYSELVEQGVIVEEYSSTLKNVRLEVIEDLRAKKNNSRYLDMALGQNVISDIKDIDLKSLKEELEKKKYPPNESQWEAIQKGIKSDLSQLVLGPPGTGKTTVILEWVRYFVKNLKYRVLISSQNNKAVDNVLERLLSDDEIEKIRIGNEDKVQENVKHLLFDERVKDLQAKVSANMEMCVEDFTGYYNELKEYIKSLNKGYELCNDLLDIRGCLHQKYNEIQKVFVNPLVRKYKKIEKLKLKISKISEAISKESKKVEEYDRKNLFLRIILFISNEFLKRKIKFNKNRLSTTAIKRRDLIREYNTLSQEYIQSLTSSDLLENKDKYSEVLDKLADIKIVVYGDAPTRLTEKTPINDIFLDREKTLMEVIENSMTIVNGEVKKTEIALKSVKEFYTEVRDTKNYALSDVLLQSVDVVAGTCVGINSQDRFKNLDFDVTIVDEAGQIQVHNVIVPLSRSPRHIMLGDHLQIPPIAQDTVLKRCEDIFLETDLIKKSFFEYLFNVYPEENKTLLDTQYRMPAEIADVLSEYFYENKYKSFKGKRNLPSRFVLFEKPFTIVSTTDSRDRFEQKHTNRGYINEYEADIAVLIIESLINEMQINPESLNSEEIGIISMYSKQVELIRNKLVEKLKFSEQLAKEIVASVDSFQGQERSVIIFSSARSSKVPGHLPRIGFLNELRRINVALSRPKDMLFFIGDIDFLKACAHVTEEFDDEENKSYGVNEKDMGDFIKLMLESIARENGKLIKSKDLKNLVQKGEANV